MREQSEFGAGGPWAELVSLPRDSLGFVRRECSSCFRTFKIKGTPLEGLLVFRRLASQVAHHNGHETAFPLTVRSCPYCGARATDEAWFTGEQRAWLDKRARTFGMELRYEQLAHVERTLGVNPSPTFLAVRPERSEARLGPEPDDMRTVPLLCCREEVKISEGWPGPVSCFYCGLEHEMGAAVIRNRLSRLLDPD